MFDGGCVPHHWMTMTVAQLRLVTLSLLVSLASSLSFMPTTLTRIAQKDAVETVTTIINDAYQSGETGILVDTEEKPFHRVTRAEMEQMIEDESIISLCIEDKVIGCIKVHSVGDGVAEWGCLAVAADSQRKGYGNLLVQAAEKHIRDVLECDVAQLELLAPSSWKHDHKERLRTWYQRMGYHLAETDDYEASTMRLPEGSLLGDRFVLATDSDFTRYRKKL